MILDAFHEASTSAVKQVKEYEKKLYSTKHRFQGWADDS